MQQPPDDAIVLPRSEAEPASPLDDLLESAAATDVPTDASADAPALDVPAADSRIPLTTAGDYADPLNLAERLIAELGAWASMLAERWTPTLGPFFASDGRTAVDSCQILSERQAELSASAS